MILRSITNSLLETIGYFPVTGIIGPRQVGKTTLVKYLIKQINKESIYLDIENPEDHTKLTDPVLFFKRNQDKCVVLDEIQRMPQLFPVLRSMIDMNRVNARFIVLGSASPDLIRDSSESLAGRIAYEELTPFNITEIADQNDIYYHWFNGGFPDAFLAPNDSVRKKWFSNFIMTYIERDLPILGLNISRDIIRKLWTMIAHIHGNVLNMNNLGRSLEVTSTTIKKYLAFLEDAFLIRQLYPYAANVKKRLVKSPKIYIRDSGILHHLLNIPVFETLESNPMLGHSWEGYVIEQITSKLDLQTQYYFYRTHEGAECDLVLVKAGRPLAGIEIKYTSSPKLTRGLNQALQDIKADQNYIITPGTDDYFINKNTRVCSLTKFLDEYLALY
jgi:predicted AAA+ superfamily ATPase